LSGEGNDGEAAAAIRLTLAARPPFAVGPLLEFLAARSIAGVERIEGGRLRRTVAIDGDAGWVEVAAGRDRPSVEILVSAELLKRLPAVIRMVRRVFDLDARPDLIAERLGAATPPVGSIEDEPGLQIPGSWSGFEVLWRAILGQQISVVAATTLAGRFADALGTPITTPHAGLTRLTPTPTRVAAAEPEELLKLGIIRARVNAVQTAARALNEGRIRLDGTPSFHLVEQLKQLPGVGDWTARYVAMRLGDPDSFPAGDLVLRRVAGIDRERELARAAEAWRPYRSYAALHLWRMTAASARITLASTHPKAEMVGAAATGRSRRKRT